MRNNALVSVAALPPQPTILRTSTLPFVFTGPLKVLHQSGNLLYTLLYRLPASRHLLVQNPPSIPVLLIAYLVRILRGTKLTIDWHNYGYTILSQKLTSSHPLVRISRLYEQTLAGLAPTANFTVTHAMAKQLRTKPWNVKSPIFTLHDRPAAIFQPITSSSIRREFLSTLDVTRHEAEAIMTGNMRLIVSSTSWTPDEDFNLLLEALVSYATNFPSAPPILAVITGKGPDKAHYISQISRLRCSGQLGKISIKTAWLSLSDYASLLACADLGICLHMSSSGVDLPMKVVDMFGSGCPVVGYAGYESWAELVVEGKNGKGFETSEELKDVLGELLGGDVQEELERLREGARIEGKRRWDMEWDRVAKGLFFDSE